MFRSQDEIDDANGMGNIIGQVPAGCYTQNDFPCIASIGCPIPLNARDAF